ncbi:polyprenyl synthetase family protein [Spiribacter halobius]|uniref:Octaprenyl diphosphate synthase n=1 Tax=Sediminicurvatus halobius TaxID=2182432 RepID=A0A2U2N7W3_9GAMM|nr:polyprenyl synthetase family protein [Spiribacter halobius]PWG65157.1 octaprenyl diphosphate synthase [Spiribacter halobius]UEX78893.1 polyprenyl synthetase family protein [Spiribacter halobius]
MDLAPLRALVADDMATVDQLIRARLRSDVSLINQLGNYIIGGGGKRLRPLVVVLTARAAGLAGERDDHALLAAIVELIHTATLLHDDVVDDSEVRRGRETANQIWGNEASVLVGDFLYTRSFQMMVELQDMHVMEVFSRTTNTIAEGEVLQLLHVHDPDVTEARYREVIYRKTAALFEAGCRLGAHLAAPGDGALADATAAYGRHLGNAFQLIDDALDYDGDPQHIGKNLGDDLAEGKPTLPLIRTLATTDEDTRALLRRVIEQGGRDDIAAVREAIARAGAIPYTRALAEAEAGKAREALRELPEGEFRNALETLADFAISRDH